MGSPLTFTRVVRGCPGVRVTGAFAVAVAGVLLACGTVLELGDGNPAIAPDGAVIDAPAACAVTVDQTTIDFGDALVGARITANLRLENASGAPVTVSATLTGPSNGGFDVVPSLVVAAGSAQLAVGFTGNLNGLAGGEAPPASLRLAWGNGCSLPVITLIAHTVTTSYAISPGTIDFAARCGQTPPAKEVVIQGSGPGASWTAVSMPPTPPPFTIAAWGPIAASPTLIPVTAVMPPPDRPGTAKTSIAMTVTDTTGVAVTKTIGVTVTSLGASVTFMPAKVPVRPAGTGKFTVLNSGNEPASLFFFKQGFSFSPANLTVQPGPSNAVPVNISATSNPPAGLYGVTVSPSAPGPCFTQPLDIQFGP